MTATARKMFRFLLRARGCKPVSVVVSLTQAQFENDATRVAAIKQAAPLWGMTGEYITDEQPFVADGFEEKLRAAIGERADVADMRAAYPDSHWRRDREMFDIEGVRCLVFVRQHTAGTHITWAPMLEEDEYDAMKELAGEEWLADFEQAA